LILHYLGKHRIVDNEESKFLFEGDIDGIDPESILSAADMVSSKLSQQFFKNTSFFMKKKHQFFHEKKLSFFLKKHVANNGIRDEEKRWPNGVVPYVLSKEFGKSFFGHEHHTAQDMYVYGKISEGLFSNDSAHSNFKSHGTVRYEMLELFAIL
jgi:hypothetical protein